MGTVYKRGKIWYIDFYVKGRRVRRRVGKSKEIAQLALKDAEVKAAREEYGFAKTDIDVEKLFGEFLKYSRTNHSTATYNRYRAVIDNFKRFMDTMPEIVKASQITPKVVDDYKTFRKEEWVNPNGFRIESDDDVRDSTRRGAKAKTINFEIDVLRTIFNLAIKWDYMKTNPTKGVVRLKVKDSKVPRFLSKEECKLLLDNSPDDLRPIFITLLNTGMRKGELENLEWSDIDLKRRKISIRAKEFWHPKTGEREIPINDQLFELLSRLRKKKPRSRETDFVFIDRDGSQLKTKLREAMIKVAKKAGIENLTTLHALRHTFASHLIMNGVDLPTVQKLMGHTDIQVTMIYAHLAQDHLNEAVNKLDF